VLTLQGGVDHHMKSNNSTYNAFKRTYSPLELGVPLPLTYNDANDNDLCDDESETMNNTNEYKIDEANSHLLKV
jgi:hypothetical protein